MKPNLNRTIFESKDGSKTLYWEDFDEHYHSVNGALTESNHVFLQAGLQQKQHLDTISIFEMGFGTGLNALLTYEYAQKHHLNIHYTSIELFPVTLNELEQLDLKEILQLDDATIEDFHKAEWNVATPFNNFTLNKVQGDLTKYTPQQKFDVIYYDAFAPSAQPELWTPEIFQKLYDSLNEDGILVTYCAKGQVKRDLKSVGFTIEAIPGPPGKREMTRAIKTISE